ncbi:hypothetical protein GGU10DRAFT_386166 [Lentinula aff. detonsa]|uniref:Uncharacterized protein n=1 Tax=Lentinula aff. detonsa TaxID=2804958 RepID=A0AA38NKC4_9AGAR|nr:hypothetical protein GGU10DRAFT_386166 [Lentinula aff. detonsa]
MQPVNPTETKPSMKSYNTCFGGFPILHQDGLKWANSIRQRNGDRLLTAAPSHDLHINHTLSEEVVALGGVKCLPYGRRKPKEPYPMFLVIVRAENGEFWAIGGDMQEGSDMTEGPAEEIGKELLRKEGIPYMDFVTAFANSKEFYS